MDLNYKNEFKQIQKFTVQKSEILKFNSKTKNNKIKMEDYFTTEVNRMCSMLI